MCGVHDVRVKRVRVCICGAVWWYLVVSALGGHVWWYLVVSSLRSRVWWSSRLSPAGVVWYGMMRCGVAWRSASLSSKALRRPHLHVFMLPPASPTPAKVKGEECHDPQRAQIVIQ